MHPLFDPAPETRMEIEIRQSHELEPFERQELAAWLALVFPPDGYVWSSFDRMALGRVDGQVVAHAGVTVREILVDGRPMRVGGIGGVATRPEWRGHGFATEAVVAARAFLCSTERVEFLLLVCLVDVEAFYRDLGWETVAGPVWFEQPQGKTLWPNVAMVWPCAGKPWPGGSIDLCGVPW